MKFNAGLSRKMAKIVGAKVKDCFRNSALVTLTLMGDGDPVLCEGYAVSIIPIEHAWVEYNGDIIDPTITNGCVVYHPLYKWDAEKVDRHASNGGTFPIAGHLHKGMTAQEHADLFQKLIDLANK